MDHSFFVKSFILPLFAEGKDLEVRVNTRYARLVTVGDVLVFNNLIRRKVCAIRRYPNFSSMLQVENYKRFYPKATNNGQLLCSLQGIYNKFQEAQGVIVFELVQVE